MIARSLLFWPLLALGVVACGTPAREDGPDAGTDVADAGPPPEDQCTNDTDLAWLEGSVDGGLTGREHAREAAGDCGLGCLSDSAPDQCAIRCMTNIKGVRISGGCAGCYGGIVLCTIDKCLPQCIDDPQAEGCKDCQDTKGCSATFDTCSGLAPTDE